MPPVDVEVPPPFLPGPLGGTGGTEGPGGGGGTGEAGGTGGSNGGGPPIVPSFNTTTVRDASQVRCAPSVSRHWARTVNAPVVP
jgi:hypothetical protein